MKEEDADLLNQIREVWEAIKKIKYGSVEIVIHASQIVQIETREKLRFEKKQAF